MAKKSISPELASALVDPTGKGFCSYFVIIEDRNGKEMLFEYNTAQDILSGRLTGRDLVVKAGQMGITTYFLLARGFKRVLTEDNVTAVVVAHEEFLTQRLLKRVDSAYRRLPLPDHLKPKMHHDSAYEKSFPARNSVFYIGTAGAKTFGRGEPIHIFIGSEVAFWPDAEKIITPTEQRVPIDGEMYLESTPNGQGSDRVPNKFYEMVQEAVGGHSIWNLITLEWWLEPSYQLPRGHKFAVKLGIGGDLSYSIDEIGIITKAGWTDQEAEDRIRWRRWKIQSIKAKFWQEFYEDIVSCFLSTGEPFYYQDPHLHKKVIADCRDPNTYFKAAKIWYEPDFGDGKLPVYFISVDPGQGKITRSVATVWRLDLDDFGTIRHEASLSGFFPPETFAPMVMELGEYYGNAQIAAERNGHGAAFCGAISDYPSIFYQSDMISGEITKQIGWATTGASRIGAMGSKMYMMTQLQTLLPNIVTHDIDLVSELNQVKYSGNNIVFLGSDDFHDSAAIMAATRHTVSSEQPRGYIGALSPL
jgi:hypothetical protein